ncbi:MAG TPA: SBBP repeat-containing protein, partial [Pyrinomonadaceae bacterium]
MKYPIKFTCLISLALVLVPFSNSRKAGAEKIEHNILKHNINVPFIFEPNVGQTDPRVRYLAHIAGADFYFTPDEAVFRFVKGKKGHTLRLAFVGAQPAPQIEGAQPSSGKVNYLIGNDKKNWRTDLPTFGEVVYRDLWPGIDLAFRGEVGALKYEFRVAPGADPGNIRLAYQGADHLSLGRDGELIVNTSLGVLRDSQPVSYQEHLLTRIPVSSRYALANDNYGFEVGAYDHSKPLIIDPGLDYSTYLGGSGQEQGFDIAVDSGGNAYVTGSIFLSPDFPTTAGAFDRTADGNQDGFVTKFDPFGALVYSTYLGGSNSETGGTGIAVDSFGNAYVVGITPSLDFPTTPGAFDTTYNGSTDVFVTKLNPAGNGLVYSTYLGGSRNEGGAGDSISPDIAIDASGNAYITSNTGSQDFPTTVGAYERTPKTLSAGFVTKLNPSGSALVYSTYFGGGGSTVSWGLGIAIDGSGSAYVT